MLRKVESKRVVCGPETLTDANEIDMLHYSFLHMVNLEHKAQKYISSLCITIKATSVRICRIYTSSKRNCGRPK